MKILVTSGSFCQFDRTPLERLTAEGKFEVIVTPHGRTLTEEEALEWYRPDIDGVIAGTEPITARVIEQAKSLKVISRIGVGLDSIDLAVAQKKGIKIYRSGDGVVEAVAELTIGLILACLRRIAEADRRMRKGYWDELMGSLLKGKTIGILGLGSIGKKVVQLCQVFGVRFLVYDQIQDHSFSKQYGVLYVDLEDLLGQSDIVSIHLTLTPETKNILNANRLRFLKRGAILVNTARGGLVDEAALYDLLKAKQLGAAAIDVYEQEPYNGPFRELDNVILSCHMGTCAKETRIQMERQAVQNLMSDVSWSLGGA